MSICGNQWLNAVVATSKGSLNPPEADFILGGVSDWQSLKEGAPPVSLTSNDRLLSCGCTVAPAICTGGEIRSVLTVPACGVRIKQNARIALLRPLG